MLSNTLPVKVNDTYVEDTLGVSMPSETGILLTISSIINFVWSCKLYRMGK